MSTIPNRLEHRTHRRDWLRASAAGLLAGAGLSGRTLAGATTPAPVEARAVTRGPQHHFFGYYDKCPWGADGRHLLAMGVDFCDRQPRPGELLTIGMVDLRDGDRYVELDRTPAWCWQQGTMLQWLGSAPDREVVYNSVEDDAYVAIVRDVTSGRTRTLPLPVYALSADGRQAVSLPFDRLNRLRPGYGYCALPERYADDPAPPEAGIRRIDMTTGEHSLIVPIAELAAFRPDARFRGAQHWVNHLQFNPSGTRLILLHRWQRPDESNRTTRLFTVKPDGTDLRLHADDGMTSHFDWRDDRTILAWARVKGRGDRFYLFDVDGGEPEVVGEGILTKDGHCSYSPDRRWILNDTYPDAERNQHLMLYRPSDRTRVDLNKFYLPPKLTGPFRCDLHPRWNRDGTQVCIDSGHAATRQVYVLDVGPIVRG